MKKMFTFSVISCSQQPIFKGRKSIEPIWGRPEKNKVELGYDYQQPSDTID